MAMVCSTHSPWAETKGLWFRLTVIGSGKTTAQVNKDSLLALQVEQNVPKVVTSIEKTENCGNFFIGWYDEELWTRA